MATESAQQHQDEPKDQSVLEEAKHFLVQGKRHMALEDYQSATDCLEQAVQLYDAFYGVGKIQCADAYLEYGLALVALANLEAGSGTDKLMKKAGIEEDGDEEDGEDDDAEDEDGDEEEDEEGENTEKLKAENGNGQNNEGESVAPETNGQVAMETSVASEEKSKSNGTNGATNGVEAEPTPGTSSGNTGGGEANGEEEEETEATTIEVAWEVLCLAKRLFMTDESLDGRLKLAETYQKLGEISIEWDNNDNAIDILKECLQIREAILPPGDRLIALTYYNLGLAHSFKSEIQDANDNFQKAVMVIEKKIETLSRDLEKAKETQDTIAVSSVEKEINELKELLPDIKMRMDDSKEDQEKSTEVLKRTREEMQQEDEQVKKVLLDTSKPVDDITHLVKRKAT